MQPPHGCRLAAAGPMAFDAEALKLTMRPLTCGLKLNLTR